VVHISDWRDTARARVLAYCSQFEHMPSYEEITAHMGWRDKKNCSQELNALRGEGYVRRLWGGTGGYRTEWELTDSGRVKGRELCSQNSGGGACTWSREPARRTDATSAQQ
jgi:DNA-binding HxlR family transcriptional regulator